MSKDKFKLKSLIPPKIKRIILWIVLTFIFIKGAISIAVPAPYKTMKRQVQKELENTQKSVNNINDAKAFAEAFISEFLTYKINEQEEYRTRLEEYMTNAALTNINSNLIADSEVISSIAIKCNKVSSSQYDIDVQAKVKYTDTERDVYIRVPLSEKDGNYVVEDLPMFISKQDKVEIENKILDGTLVEPDVAASIKDTLSNFLKAYCEGTQTEIKYYLYKPELINKVGSIGGNKKFKEVDEIKAYEKGEVIKVIVTYTIEDLNGQQFKQNANFDIKEKNQRDYILSFEPRSVNLKEEMDNE